MNQNNQQACSAQAAAAIIAGNRPIARLDLENSIDTAQGDIKTWLLYAWTSDSPADAELAIDQALEVDPKNELALAGKRWIAGISDLSKDMVVQQDTDTDSSPSNGLGPNESIPDSPTGNSAMEELAAFELCSDNRSEPSSDLATAEDTEAATQLSLEDTAIFKGPEQPVVDVEASDNSEPDSDTAIDTQTLTEAELIEQADETDAFDSVNSCAAETDHDETQDANEKQSTRDDSATSQAADSVNASDDAIVIDAELVTTAQDDPTEKSIVAEAVEIVDPKAIDIPEAILTSTTDTKANEPTPRVKVAEKTTDAVKQAIDTALLASQSTPPVETAEIAAEKDVATVPGSPDNPKNTSTNPADSRQTKKSVSAAVADECELAEKNIQRQVKEISESVAESVKPKSVKPELTTTKTPNQSTADDAAPVVMIVDDSPTIRKLVSITLGRNGFNVIAASDGLEAMTMLSKRRPDLVLTDVNLPNQSGYQLCEFIKKNSETASIPVVLLSSKNGVVEKMRHKLSGASGNIKKPFESADLIEKVQQYLLASTSS